MILNNYVLRITAVIIVYGDSIEVPTCGRAKISVLDPLRMLRKALKLSKVTTDFDAKSRVFCQIGIYDCGPFFGFLGM